MTTSADNRENQNTTNSFMHLHPEIAQEWHPTKNKDKISNKISSGSNILYWWLCPKGHSYQQSVKSRTRKKYPSSCPYCSGRKVCRDNCLSTVCPDIAKEWDHKKNGELKPSDITRGSNKKVWWLCPKKHSYNAQILSRTNGTGCPYCAGKRAYHDNCLSTLYPEIAKEWHSNKNGKLTPNDVTKASTKKVWWLCPKNHSYQASIAQRTYGHNCPKCSGKTACYDNCIATLYPEIAREWHPSKNGKLTPNKVTKGSHQKVWWVCPKGHQYQTKVVYRTLSNSKCPYCAGRKVCHDNCLATLYPKIAKEWDQEKNGSLTPNDVTKSSFKRIWWCCSKKHSFQSTVAQRTQGRGCPYCSGRKLCQDNCLQQVYPDIAREWHPSKNGKLTPNDVTKASGKEVWWRCPDGHSYFCGVNQRAKGNGCPYCSGHKTCKDNSLALLLPDIAKEWHPKNNQPLTPDNVTKKSSLIVWWKCPNNHDYEARVYSRAIGRGCPYCSGHKVDVSNSLATLRPELAKEWHPTKNKSLTPQTITIGSGKRVWWLCANGHTYQKSVNRRTCPNPTNCPYCSGKKVCEDNSLATVCPDIAKEWHPSKNGKLTPDDFTKGSGKKVWWLCPKGHEYFSLIKSRTLKLSSCPYCSNQTSRAEIRVLTELSYIFKEIESRQKLHKQEVDVYIPKYKVGIEYDGSYYHRGDKLQKDQNKNEILSNKGIELIRIREHPLKKISRHDISLKKSLNKKDINTLLLRIKKLKKLPNHILEKIKNYIAQEKFQNESAYREYLSYYPSPHPKDSLLFQKPHLAKEWDYNKNFPLLPESFSHGSMFKAYWLCPSKHSYKASITKRSRGRGCPYCARKKTTKITSLASQASKLSEEWHPSKNGNLTPKDVTSGSNRKVWWLCPNKHEYEATIVRRFAGRKCPYCSGRKVCKENSLAHLYPTLVTEWHPKKNHPLTPENVTRGSHLKVWWKCQNGHDYEAIVKNKVKGSRCPYCFGSKACKQNSLASLHPNIAQEWHPSKNKDLTPDKITCGSGKKIWWICPEKHVYQATILSRTYGSACPYCSNHRVCKDNSLATLYPKIAKEWHPEKNNELKPTDITKGSNKKVWWLCPEGHEYYAQVYSRVSGRKCPYCSGNKATPKNCLAYLYPDIAKEWHPSKNGKLTPNDVTKGSNKRIWWFCPNGHNYESTIKARTRTNNKNFCPECRNK
ncbi:zinc-ribbon domain-containing protein [Legionella impletisoli]|uniref:zinc-ribbon domain-containing protein n=1 Tax=Legionella impletisoli TaxID=343510 RepID=UPI0010411652|nr:zinc-ribbon domain-containing protein [Legionella impletisoli]